MFACLQQILINTKLTNYNSHLFSVASPALPAKTFGQYFLRWPGMPCSKLGPKLVIVSPPRLRLTKLCHRRHLVTTTSIHVRCLTKQTRTVKRIKQCPRPRAIKAGIERRPGSWLSKRLSPASELRLSAFCSLEHRPTIDASRHPNYQRVHVRHTPRP